MTKRLIKDISIFVAFMGAVILLAQSISSGAYFARQKTAESTFDTDDFAIVIDIGVDVEHVFPLYLRQATKFMEDEAERDPKFDMCVQAVTVSIENVGRAMVKVRTQMFPDMSTTPLRYAAIDKRGAEIADADGDGFLDYMAIILENYSEEDEEGNPLTPLEALVEHNKNVFLDRLLETEEKLLFTLLFWIDYDEMTVKKAGDDPAYYYEQKNESAKFTEFEAEILVKGVDKNAP